MNAFRICTGVALVAFGPVVLGDETPLPRTFFVTRSMAHEQLLPYLEAARPEIVQIGQYGPMFHGYADNPKSKGTPMQLPLTGERDVLDFQRDLNAKIHDLGLKAVGHFRLVKAYGEWETRSGFVDYYDNRWPEDLLGPKPHADLLELVQRAADGTPHQTSRYEQAQIAFCLSSPHARQMFKQMLKLAVDRGVDGMITTYNYDLECACPYCQADFRGWLGKELSAGEIKVRLGISDLENHTFEAIPAKISGYPDPETATELDWLAMRWAAASFKRNFDEVFIDYGRSLKPDLLVAQWNHMSHVSAGNERMFLPVKDWGKGESYFWESGGASFVGKNLSLAEHQAGDAWLSCLVIRELGGGKPFVMGKYDGIRLAASMAEGYATGGLGMGRYMRFEDPNGFETLVRYTNFMHRNRELFDGAKPFSDAALVLPRAAAWSGNSAPFDDFRALGQALLEQQLLIDVIADENLTAERLGEFPAVILPDGFALPEGLDLDNEVLPNEGGDKLPKIAKRIWKGGGTKIEAPWTVRAAAYEQENRVVLHLVNYDRDESKSEDRKITGPILERPIATGEISVDLRLPAGTKATAVRLHTPENAEPVELKFAVASGRATFAVPSILVYAVIAIETAAAE